MRRVRLNDTAHVAVSSFSCWLRWPGLTQIDRREFGSADNRRSYFQETSV
jgi:hypothetical protein